MRALKVQPVLTTDAPPTLFCRPVRRGATLVVHLLNLNVDTESDTATPVGPCRLSIPLPAGQTAGAVRLLSPDGPAGGQVLTAQVGQGLVTVNVPGVRIWSLVAVALK